MSDKWGKLCVVLYALIFSCTAASAQETVIASEMLTEIQSNLNALLLVVAAALVLFMQVGFAFLEAGVCRSKNVVNIMMKNFVDIGISVIVFWAVGYAFLFGENLTGLIGTSNFFLQGLSDGGYAYVVYQMMFAATAVTITSGAMAERTQFFGYLISAVVITGFIYPIAAGWIWNGVHAVHGSGDGQGWLAKLGFIDFAGSTAVHSVGGWVALAGVIIVGARTGRFDENGKPKLILGHNISYAAFGGVILWVGWFGFNVGSIESVDLTIGRIALVTHMGAAGGIIGIVIVQKLLKQPVLLITSINGALGGLVSVTAAAGTIAPSYALVVGIIGGVVVYFGDRLLLRFQIDDVVGAIPVHLFAGVWGTLAAGIFYQGDMFSANKIVVQAIGVLSIAVWSLGTAFTIYYIIDKIFGLRVERRSERRGLDYSEHYEVAYPEFTDVMTHNEKTTLTPEIK